MLPPCTVQSRGQTLGAFACSVGVEVTVVLNIPNEGPICKNEKVSPQTLFSALWGTGKGSSHRDHAVQNDKQWPIVPAICSRFRTFCSLKWPCSRSSHSARRLSAPTVARCSLIWISKWVVFHGHLTRCQCAGAMKQHTYVFIGVARDGAQGTHVPSQCEWT